MCPETVAGGGRWEAPQWWPRRSLPLPLRIPESPRGLVKGMIIRDADRRVLEIVEQRDIDAIADSKRRQVLDARTKGNCPLYATRARMLRRLLEKLPNANDNITSRTSRK